MLVLAMQFSKNTTSKHEDADTMNVPASPQQHNKETVRSLKTEDRMVNTSKCSNWKPTHKH
jgi:hypothetical protein